MPAGEPCPGLPFTRVVKYLDSVAIIWFRIHIRTSTRGESPSRAALLIYFPDLERSSTVSVGGHGYRGCQPDSLDLVRWQVGQ